MTPRFSAVFAPPSRLILRSTRQETSHIVHFWPRLFSCGNPAINRGYTIEEPLSSRLLISSANMATRRYSVVGRAGRPPLSAHSHQVNSVNKKNLDGNNFASHLIKTKTPSSPTMKGPKPVLCTPDVYTKERSFCPILRPQVHFRSFPILLLCCCHTVCANVS